MKKWWWLVSIAAVALAGCSDVSKTEETVLAWGTALNLHLTTGGIDSNFAYPFKLEEIDEELRFGLSDVDAWGNKLFYRRLRDDAYNLISAGADGELGNDDDIVMENGLLYEPATVYGRTPLNR
ncbi:MAG: hypothetical protein V3T72_09900 [Thermoanaerobaculia bacterium]